MPQALLPLFPSECTPINDVVSFCRRDGMLQYFHGCLPVFCHPDGDMKSFRMFTSQLVVNGNCKQVEIVKAFGISAISMKRYVKKYREGGPSAFFAERKRRGATVLTPAVMDEAQRRLHDGVSKEEVAEELGVKINTLAKAVRDGRLVVPEKKTRKRRPRVSVAY